MAYNLFINYDASTPASIFLDGASKAAPVRGAHYSPGRGARSVDEQGRELITEEITVDLAGTYRVITDWITALNVLLEIQKGGAWHNPLGRLRLCLEEPDDANHFYWWSEIVDAWLTLDQNGLAQRNTGQQMITLRITRADRWEYTSQGNVQVIAFPGGSDQNTQTYMLNHYDSTAGHTNWGYIGMGANLKGDLPNRVLLQFRTGMAGRKIGDALIGCGWSDQGAPNVVNMLPTLQESSLTAGAGVTKADAADASCAGGNYATFSWSTATETLVFKATLPTSLYSQDLSHGRPFKPVIRLQAGAAYSDVYFRAKVLIGPSSSVLYETDFVLYPLSAPLIELPPVYVPPEGTYEVTSIELAIYAILGAASPRTFAIDFLQVWPVDGGFRKYKFISYISATGQIYDHPASGTLCWCNNSLTGQRAVVNGYGREIMLHPGKTNVLAFANLTAGTTWAIDDQINLWISAFAAKRNL